MPISQQRVTVLNTATRLDISTSTACSQSAVTVRNRSATTFYVGGSDVTSSTGYQLDTGDAITVSADRAYFGALYGITASGTSTAHVLEVWT
jgi:hypothetical protein